MNSDRVFTEKPISARDAVAEARANGESWGTIGMVLGVSRQAAQLRFRGV